MVQLFGGWQPSSFLDQAVALLPRRVSVVPLHSWSDRIIISILLSRLVFVELCLRADFWPHQARHSERKATIGSTLAARHAGTYVAATAAINKVTATPANTPKSIAATPYSKFFNTRPTR